MTRRGRHDAVAIGLFLALLASVSSCAHTLPGDAIVIRVECNVPDATVWIDDLLVGTASNWRAEGRPIRAGFHRIEIRHPGYYSFFQEVEVPGGSHVVVDAKLREVIE